MPEEEESVLPYLALSVGPLGKDITTVVGHLNALSYFRRVKSGFNPISHMPRVSLMIRGLRRAKGPTQRKLPITIEDLTTLHDMIDHTDINQQTLWGTVLLGWFFMLRRGLLVDNNNKTRPAERHPLWLSDIDPLCQGNLANWGGARRRNYGAHIGPQNRLAQSGLRAYALSCPSIAPQSEHMCCQGPGGFVRTFPG